MSGARHLACVIGWPVNRSLSPAIHRAAFDALGLDWTYIAVAVRPGAAAEGIDLLRTLGADGVNVTMPHKQAVVPLLDELDGEAAELGAVNTIVRDGDRLIGHNTDGAGFVRFLTHDAVVDPSGLRALVLGAGGAARAVARSLVHAGAEVTVQARRIDQATETATIAGASVAKWGKAVPCDLVVNATPSREVTVPVRKAQIVVDLIYQPPETALLAAARAAGVRAFDGLGMLVHQAALSFELWTGREAPVEVMRSAAARALSAL